MLTRPNVRKPDQKDLARPSSSSSFGSGTLLLPPGVDVLEALREGRRERSGRALLGHGAEARLLPARLGLDELEDALPVLVLELRGLELAFERRDQLLGHRELAAVGGAIRRRNPRRLHDLVV